MVPLVPSCERQIHGIPESHLAAQWAYKIQKLFKTTYPEHLVIVSRHPGDPAVDQLEHAQLVNHIKPHRHIRLQISESTSREIEWYFFYYSDFTLLPKKLTDFVFHSYHKAHCCALDESRHLTDLLARMIPLYTDNNQWSVFLPVKFPLVGMEGLIPPAVVCEIGLAHDSQLDQCVAPLVEAIVRSL